MRKDCMQLCSRKHMLFAYMDEGQFIYKSASVVWHAPSLYNLCLRLQLVTELPPLQGLP